MGMVYNVCRISKLEHFCILPCEMQLKQLKLTALLVTNCVTNISRLNLEYNGTNNDIVSPDL